MDGGHVPYHVPGSSFKSDSILAFITLSSPFIFFSSADRIFSFELCFSAEGVFSFEFESFADDTIIFHLGTNVHFGAWHFWFTAMLHMDVGLQGVPPHSPVLAEVTIEKESPITFQQSNNALLLETGKKHYNVENAESDEM